MTRKFVKRSKFFILFRFQLAVVLRFFALLRLESLQKHFKVSILAQTFIKRFKPGTVLFGRAVTTVEPR